MLFLSGGRIVLLLVVQFLMRGSSNGHTHTFIKMWGKLQTWWTLGCSIWVWAGVAAELHFHWKIKNEFKTWLKFTLKSQICGVYHTFEKLWFGPNWMYIFNRGRRRLFQKRETKCFFILTLDEIMNCNLIKLFLFEDRRPWTSLTCVCLDSTGIPSHSASRSSQMQLWYTHTHTHNYPISTSTRRLPFTPSLKAM